MAAAERKFTLQPTDAQRRAIHEAEAAIAELASKFDQCVQQDVTRARELLAEAKRDGVDRRKPVEAIFNIVHNVKGQGGSFGYQLLTRIGASLCDYMRHGELRDDRSLAVIDAHISSLQFVLDQGIKGNGGPLGDKLLAKLAALKG